MDSMNEPTTLPPDIAGTVTRLLQLPANQRLEISRRLVDSITIEETDHARSAEIAERIRQIESGEVEGVDGDDVFRKLEERLGVSVL
ncbi:MAG: hypothetical protein DWQ45_18785 [Planctomycetota bacterium]|nr:MAG: hypothetical protein DWQ41_11900 [Planctomycetota bacterium]REK31660.1 MAG: hypothetical protein DWQ45_18785 [Planctomycetota bacterium]